MIENIRAILRKFLPIGFNEKEALRGLEELKKKEGFDKLPPEHQQRLIKEYIQDIKLEKQVPKILEPKKPKPRKILPPTADKWLAKKYKGLSRLV